MCEKNSDKHSDVTVLSSTTIKRQLKSNYIKQFTCHQVTIINYSSLISSFVWELVGRSERFVYAGNRKRAINIPKNITHLVFIRRTRSCAGDAAALELTVH